MKSIFLDNSISLIKKYNPDYDEYKIAELRYGLEGIYLSVTKLFIIFLLAIMLNIFKEMLLLLIFFNILRRTGFGLHASKSWICLLTSTTMFVGGPLLVNIVSFNFILKVIIGITSIILIYLYAPADTKKRPLIHEKRREKFKFITTINCIILVFISLFIPSETISELLILGIIYEVILILPITYKLFNLPYNNYKNYKY